VAGHEKRAFARPTGVERAAPTYAQIPIDGRETHAEALA